MRYSILFLFFGLLAFSCKKEAGTPPYNNTISATIDGHAVKFPTKVEVGVSRNWYGDPGQVSIIAEDPIWLFLLINKYDGTKSTFNLLRANQGGFTQSVSFGSICQDCFSFEPVSWDVHMSDSGAINIDSFDKTTYKTGEVITGTFQFDASDTTGNKSSVRNGHFSVFVPNQ